VDPDFPLCGGVEQPAPPYEEHLLRVHFSQTQVLIANHCKDGRENFGETGVDVGGNCPP
jgi:hypothetical protein